MAEQMVAAFIPSTIPILSRHSSKGGVLLGYLETLTNEGPDRRFTGLLRLPYAANGVEGR